MGFDLEVGTACNNKCLFCSAAFRTFADFSTEQILKFLQDRAGSDGDFLCITGGEPTIRPDFPKIISNAVKSGYDYILLQSNGRTFADAEFTKKALDLGLKEFLISVHGADASVHDALTQVPGSFEQTIQGIKNIIRLGGSVSTLTVITIKNFRQLADITKIMLDIGADPPVFAFPMLVGRATGNFNVLVPRYVDTAPYLIESLEIIRQRNPSRAYDSSVQDVPFCFLKGMERYVHEVNYAEMRSIYYHKDPVEIKESRSTQDSCKRDNEVSQRLQKKTKLPSCRECIYFLPCEGVQKEYIEHYGANEFVPVTSHDSSIDIKMRSVTFPGSMVPVLIGTSQFNGRDFGGFLINIEENPDKDLIVVTNRGRHALSLLFGDFTLSGIQKIGGDEILSFVLSLKERGLLSFFETKIPLDNTLLNLKNQITSRILTSRQEGLLELPLYIPWRESYQVTLI
ncbi:MAG: radical SAM protein [Firmicutes bacterium]|nr:radical SAM protein [Bacillota bacterium]